MIFSIILIYVIVFFISILITRWIFRINEIVDELKAIRALLQKSGFTVTNASPSKGLEQRTAEEPKNPSPEDTLESLTVKFNELSERITVSKDKNEKAAIRAERERIEKKMNHLKFELENKL